MKTRSRVRIGAVALLVVGLMSVAAVSEAHKKTYSTAITAAAKNKNQIEGSVSSGNPRCVPNRSVRLYSATGVLEATTTTDAQGAFRFMDKTLAVGTHYVNVTKRVIRKSRHHRHLCRAAETSLVVS